jgi:hypothetical protein
MLDLPPVQRLPLILFTAGSIGLAIAGVLAGCDRNNAGTSTVASAAKTQAATQQAVRSGDDDIASAPASPTTIPATQPFSIILIDQKRYEFPAAILQIRQKGERLSALLLSDDPKDAIDENYHGNSFFLHMPVDATDIKDLTSTAWHYVAPSNERSDTPDGIYLDGNRKQLEPSNITVRFQGDKPAMEIDLSGTFLMYDTRDENASPKVANVNGHLVAQVK